MESVIGEFGVYVALLKLHYHTYGNVVFEFMSVQFEKWFPNNTCFVWPLIRGAVEFICAIIEMHHLCAGRRPLSHKANKVMKCHAGKKIEVLECPG